MRLRLKLLLAEDGHVVVGHGAFVVGQWTDVHLRVYARLVRIRLRRRGHVRLQEPLRRTVIVEYLLV